MKAKFNNCFIIHSTYFPVLKGVSPFYSVFFCSPTITQPRPQVFSVNGSISRSALHCLLMSFWHHWFNMTKLLTSLVQYDKTLDVIGSIWQNFWCHQGNMTGQSSFQILSAAAGYGELHVVLTNQKWEIFWMNNKFMLFAGWEVCLVKNCDSGPRAVFSHPRSWFSTIRTDPKPANNMIVYFFPALIGFATDYKWVCLGTSSLNRVVCRLLMICKTRLRNEPVTDRY